MVKRYKCRFYITYLLIWCVNLTKNAELDKYKYSSYCIGFDSRSEFSFTDGNIGKNLIIFGAYMSSFVHIYNKNKDNLIHGEGTR